MATGGSSRPHSLACTQNSLLRGMFFDTLLHASIVVRTNLVRDSGDTLGQNTEIEHLPLSALEPARAKGIMVERTFDVNV